MISHVEGDIAACKILVLALFGMKPVSVGDWTAAR